MIIINVAYIHDNDKCCKICDIIIEGKSNTFKNPETKFKMNKDLSYNSKKVIYIIERSQCKEIYIGSTQALNTRTSLQRSNIKIEENRKLNVSKHLYQCSLSKFKIMPICQMKDYMVLLIKEKNLIDKFKQKLNKTWIIHTHKWKKKILYIYIHTHTHSRHTFTHREKK